jgi:hypothetical protein
MTDKTPELLTLLEYVAGGLDFNVSYQVAEGLGIIGVDLSICIAIYITGGREDSYDALIGLLEAGFEEEASKTSSASPIGLERACRVQFFARYARARGKGKNHEAALEFIAEL